MILIKKMPLNVLGSALMYSSIISCIQLSIYVNDRGTPQCTENKRKYRGRTKFAEVHHNAQKIRGSTEAEQNLQTSIYTKERFGVGEDVGKRNPLTLLVGM
jgi:hypothetical protein